MLWVLVSGHGLGTCVFRQDMGAEQFCMRATSSGRSGMRCLERGCGPRLQQYLTTYI